jgi:hypothetical protein
MRRMHTCIVSAADPVVAARIRKANCRQSRSAIPAPETTDPSNETPSLSAACVVAPRTWRPFVWVSLADGAALYTKLHHCEFARLLHVRPNPFRVRSLRPQPSPSVAVRRCTPNCTTGNLATRNQWNKLKRFETKRKRFRPPAPPQLAPPIRPYGRPINSSAAMVPTCSTRLALPNLAVSSVCSSTIRR